MRRLINDALVDLKIVAKYVFLLCNLKKFVAEGKKNDSTFRATQLKTKKQIKI